MNVDTPSVNILSLCAGIGGIDLGLGLAITGARTVCFVENEATAVEKLVARMRDGTLCSAPVWSNLKTFRGRAWRGIVDILVAGYPCQPFSVAGKQRGAADPRHLWPHVARVIRECAPGAVFLENVENHLRIGYEQVRRELQRLGYTVTEGVFSAAEVGAPHLRKRLFILAHRGSIERGLRWNQPARDPQAIGKVSDRRSDKRNNRRGEPLRCSEELAHRAQRGRGELRESPGRDGLTDGRDAQLEDAARDREHGQARADGGRRRRVREAGDELANARGAQCAGNAKRGIAGKRKQTERSGAHGALFPPGPADLAGWRETLERDPALKPSLRRISDGSSSRVDRLRACGNAVVPLVAAYAFRCLTGAAGLRKL